MWWKKKQIQIETKESKILPLFVITNKNEVVTPATDIATEDEQLALYRKEIWIYSCVKQLVQAGSSAPLRSLERKINPETKKEESIELPYKHPLSTLLRRPNPFQCKFEFMEATLTYLELVGNAYWELVRNSEEDVIEMYVHSPTYVDIIPSALNKVGGYKFTINQKERILPTEDVIHFKYFDPTDIYYGFSPALGANEAIQLDFYAQIYNKAFFQNSAIPQNVLVVPDFPDEAQRKQLDAEWQKLYKGVKKAHSTGVLWGGIDVKDLSKPPKDAAYIESRKLSREEIASAYGVPPIKLGLYEYANQAGVREQRRIFWEDTMIPMFLRIEGIINTRLVEPNFGSEFYVQFDTSNIQQLAESLLARSDAGARAFQSGLLSRNEGRAMVGYSALSNMKDEFAKPLNMLFEELNTSPSARNKAMQILSNPRNSEDIYKSMTDAEKTEIDNIFNRISK